LDAYLTPIDAIPIAAIRSQLQRNIDGRTLERTHSHRNQKCPVAAWVNGVDRVIAGVNIEIRLSAAEEDRI
jgi:hypothetical protein